jgi:TonB-linked SusC/RagA family outer membrane protein
MPLLMACFNQNVYVITIPYLMQAIQMYKNCTTNIGMPSGYVKKFLLIMKITTFVIFLAIMQASGAALSQKITFEKKDATLKEVFGEINKQTGYNIFWSPKKVKDAPRLNVSFHDTPVEDVLKVCLRNLPLTYTIEGSNVIIKEIASTSAYLADPESVDIVINGNVKDETGEGIPGVSVLLKGTTNGTTTDRDGNYQITVPSGDGGILVYSFLGYKTVEETINARTAINVQLEVDVASLEEVVVVAFGTQKKASMVSSIDAVNPSELKVPSSNLTTALAGRVSGVIAYQRSGEPGADNSDFFIRGVTTFGYKKDPLILIDGIETTTLELSRLHVDDIAAFSILKDATATALYGARGANGVIQVTTKRGNDGPATISFRFENSFSSNTQNIELADPITYMTLANEAVLTRNPLAPSLYSREKIDGTRAGANPYLYPATDWREMLVKKVVSNQRYNLNVSGGGAIARYYVSGVFYQDNGNLNVDKKSNFNNNINLKSYQMRSNISINLTKKTELITRLSGSFDDYRGPLDGGADAYKKIMRSNPVLFPAYYPASFQPGTNHLLFGNATRGSSQGAGYINPYAELVRGYKDYAKSLIDAQFELKQNLDFVLPGLAASAIFNTSRYSFFDVSRFYNPYYYSISTFNPETNEYSLGLLNANSNPTEYLNYNERDKDINSTTYLQGNIIYNAKFNDHDVSGLLVFQRRQQLFANQGSLQKSLPYRNQGVSGRFTYGYQDRLLAEFTFGYNGSERFYTDQRYGFFPAIGAGWVVSNEKFFQGFSNIVQNLKLKGTYGLVGNDAIGDENDRFFYLSNVNLSDENRKYTFGENLNQTKNGVSISRYDNRDISWETARKLNLGIELGIFNDFDIFIDYFTEHRSNILMDRASIPSAVGLAANVRANVGQAKGHGVDMSLDYNRSFGSGAWLKARGNFTYAHSEFVKYEEPEYVEGYRYHKGQPINQIYGLVAERLFVDETEVNNSPKQNFGEYHAGDIKYRDMNGDGQITDADQVPIGHPWLPEIVYGFGFSFGHKGVDFSAFFQGSARSSFWLDASNTSPFQNDVPLLQAYADSHWSEENRNLYAVWPRLSTTYNGNNFSRYSTWFMRNGAFLRVKTIELGYTLTQAQSRKLGMESARIYVSGNNLFLLSGFDMWDIEMGGNGLGYPIQKVYNLGVQIKF